MKIVSYKNKNFESQLEKLYNRQAVPLHVENEVKKILEDVKENGNSAIKKYALKFDNCKFARSSEFLVREEEILESEKLISGQCKKSIKKALENITVFAENRIPQPWTYSPRPGVITGERFEPLERVGVYIPGGTAPLVSTVIHTAGIAKAAGVREIVAVTPPGKDGKIHPAVLFAMKEAGVTELYKIGGVYAIGALAYGTKTIRKVEKIVGPGNAYVTAAKKLVFGEVAIDMIAGPSEIMIIADSKAEPAFIAADMLSQAEHGSGLEQAVLVTDSIDLIENVTKELESQAVSLSRNAMVKKVLSDGVFFIHVSDMSEAPEIASRYAPEHLEIMCEHPGNTAKKVRAAGAIFIGQWTPEPVGDFVAGPSHVLPTGGSSKYFSGLTVESFFRRMSIINYQKAALQSELANILCFAEMEGLDAHGRSASIRIKGKPKS
ncbi:MAG: histidinol dehydrogenase [Lentisphaerae bacterium GWF2_45_14]|nr:MAG: histidinol dehydrogenase [Lentisphaerae bacterium GWF2_45_14]